MSHENSTIAIRVLPDGLPMVLKGRESWFCKTLIKVGDRGITSLETPGARISHYCMKLRRKGLVIETIDETHPGPFKGVHGRYRLVSQIEVVRDSEKAAAA